MRQKLSFVSIVTLLGVVLGSSVWFIAYVTVYNPAIGFNGPAGLGLGLSMAVGGLIFGLLGTGIYAHNNKNRSFLQAFVICMVSGCFACLVTGYVISKYEISHILAIAWKKDLMEPV